VVPAPIVLYSTNTKLAYHLSQRYYGGVHFVWCSPFWGKGALPGFEATTPPSSSPLEIYRQFYEETTRGEGHSDKIERNRGGLRRGAQYRLDSKLITEAVFRDIDSILTRVEVAAFRPLLYVIPYCLVRDLIAPVPIEKRAHPLSDEYIIENLPRDTFDVIELPL
jgi:hypothetical protein